MAFVAPIVEGQGEVAALPALLHRIASSEIPGTPLTVNPPYRVRAQRFLHNEGEFSRVLELAARKAAMRGGFVLILLDCDDACPAELGPEILRRAHEIRSDVTIVVALAHREFESWFLASAHSLRGQKGLPVDLEPPEDSSTIRDAKGWLSQRMGRKYSPVADQAALCRHLDLELAQSNRSFARFLGKLRIELGRHPD